MNGAVQQSHGIGMTSLRTRRRLVERLRRAGIRDERVLEALLNVPRHLFMEEALASRAYEDTALPIGFGQTISQPFMVAWMTETLLAGSGPRGRPPVKVLEIGTGSGYQTAVLAWLVDRVFTIERIARLTEQARERVRGLGLGQVWFKHGDGRLGWEWHAPFDGIVITAAAERLPERLLAQLAPGGRLVAPVGSAHRQHLVVVERRAGGFEQQTLGEVSFVPLLGGVS